MLDAIPTGVTNTIVPILAALGGIYLAGAVVAYARGEDVSRMWGGDRVEVVAQVGLALVAVWLAVSAL